MYKSTLVPIFLSVREISLADSKLEIPLTRKILAFPSNSHEQGFTVCPMHMQIVA